MTLEKVQNQPSTKIQVQITKDSTVLGELRNIPLSTLKLDPKNVRFRHLDASLNDKAIEQWIWDESDTKSLLREIKFSGGLSEKPFVQEAPEGDYRVVEGNRRTVCMRKIAKEIKSGKETEIQISNIDPIQCIVIPRDVSHKWLAIFLARIHVSGKKDWAALNQSAHVYDLISKHDYQYDDVANAISISKTKVTQMKNAYESTLKYKDRYPDDNLWLRRYSHFEELWKKKSLREWASDPRNLGSFMQWVHDNQFPMAIKVRKLDPIIQDGKDAYQAIKKGTTIDEATEILQHQKQKRTISAQLADEVEGKVSEFQELLQNFPRGKMKEMAKDKEKLKQFEELYKEFGQVIKDIRTIDG